MSCRLPRRTVDREREDAEMRAAAVDATWAAVEELGDRPFSYMDVNWWVWARLEDLGYDTRQAHSIWVDRTVREMADAGILRRVRAFAPPSRPHLFILESA